MTDAKMDEFDGFAILEEAALAMIGASPEQECELLKFYRCNLERLLLDELDDPQLATAIADRYLGIIVQRRKEIELASGANQTQRIQ